MFTKILYLLAIVIVLLSFCKDRDKTKLALQKSWKSFNNILPSVLFLLLLISLVLALLNENIISSLLGEQSGILGIGIAAVIGSIALIPGFVAFPMAAELLKVNAGYAQIAMFISSLMMVGVTALPLEARYFGKKTAIKRNLFSLIAAIIISCVIGVIMK